MSDLFLSCHKRQMQRDRAVFPAVALDIRVADDRRVISGIIL